MENIDKRNFKSQYLDDFSAYENSLNGEKNSPEFAFKKSAYDKIAISSLPTMKSEDWRYINLGFLNETQYVRADKSAVESVNQSDVLDFTFPNFKNDRLVFVNGFYSKELSSVSEIGYTFEDLSSALKNKDIFEYYGKLTAERPTFFTNINDSIACDGAFVKINKNTTLEAPIHILHVIDARTGQVSCTPRNLIVVGENSQVKIFETYAVLGENKALVNQATEIFIGKNSTVENSIIQNYPKNIAFIGFTQAAQESGSVFNNTTVSLDGAFVRNNLNSILKGSHTETHYFGFYYADSKNIIDNRTFVDHAVPHCESNEIYKGIIGGEAVATFNGKILVRKDAQKTNAYQSNKNVLLSDAATINTKPELEIYADDVKCSHGATSGALDKESLFYLRSRGISEDRAVALLLTAFGGEISEKITIDELKDYVDTLIEQRLKF